MPLFPAINMARNINHEAEAFVKNDTKSIHYNLWRASRNDSRMWTSTVPNSKGDSTAFISLKSVLVYRALISAACGMSPTVNRLIMPQHKVKGWQGELPDSLAN